MKRHFTIGLFLAVLYVSGTLREPSAVALGPAAAEESELHDWTTTDGQKVRASLLRSETVYVLRKEDGTEIRFAASTLSEASRALAEKVLSQRRAGGARQAILGEVVSIVDGDTLIVADEAKTQHRVRLEGIDCPESGQDYGTHARKALAEKVFRKKVRVRWQERDREKRVIGAVYLDDRWINKEMVAEGWAWHYKICSDSQALAGAEAKARTAKAGLWQGESPMPPWEYREKLRSRDVPHSPQKPKPTVRRVPPQPSDAIVFVTATGTKYHRAGCPHLAKSAIPVPLSQARARYSPCTVCNPPR